MKSPVIAYVGWLLLLSVFGFYAYGIYEAIVLSLGTKPIEITKYSPVLATTISSMQALLLTNLGILLGISISKPNSSIARQLMLSKSGGLEDGRVLSDPLQLKDKVQLFALVVYILSLIACVITWIRRDFLSDPKDVISVIPESGKMFLGVLLAYLTAVLTKSPSS